MHMNLRTLEVAGFPVNQCQLVNRLGISPVNTNAIVFRYNDLNLKDLR